MRSGAVCCQPLLYLTTSCRNPGVISPYRLFLPAEQLRVPLRKGVLYAAEAGGIHVLLLPRQVSNYFGCAAYFAGAAFFAADFALIRRVTGTFKSGANMEP